MSGFNITSLPDYTDTIVFQSSDFYEKSSNLLEVLSDVVSQLNYNINFEKAKSSGNTLEDTFILFKRLNDENFLIDGEQFDDIFKNYYIEKYNSLFKNIRVALSTYIGSENIYFRNYSDDIGILTDSNSIVDNSIAPYFDYFYDKNLNPVPNNLNSTIYNKVTDDKKLMQKKFSKLNDSILKNNLKGITDYTSAEAAKGSGGFNLVTDYSYYLRFYKYKEPLAQNISSLLKGLGDYVLFIKNLNNRDNDTLASRFDFNYDIEGIETQVDLLKNKLTSNPYIDNVPLSSQ